MMWVALMWLRSQDGDTAVNVIITTNLWPLWEVGEFLASRVILRFGEGIFSMKWDSYVTMWVRHRINTCCGSLAAQNFKYIYNYLQTVYHRPNKILTSEVIAYKKENIVFQNISWKTQTNRHLVSFNLL